MTSGERKGDPRFHGQGKALDVQLYDAQGRKLSNYQSAETFRPYEQFAQAVHAAQPADTAPIRWGGYFGGPKGTYGAVDLMHFDTGNVPMGGGSWEGGLTDAQRKLFPGAQSVGFGTTINSATAPVAGALAKQEVGPEGVGGGAPVAASDGPQDPRQIMFNRLVAAGVPKQAALGALWSLGGEGGAGLDPRSYNAKDPGGSIGYGQWNGVRRTALEDLAKQNGTSWADPNTQADHTINELTNKDYATYQPGVLAALQQAKTPEEGARIWTSKFERPTKDNSDQRIAGGPQVASFDQNGNLALGSATGGGPAPSSTAPGSPAAPAADQPWWQSAYGKLVDKPKDAQGRPTGDKSPYENLADAFQKGPARMRALEEDQAPEQVRNYTGAAPLAENVSPGLSSNPSIRDPARKAYGTTLDSFMQPLTWKSTPPQAPQMLQAGLQSALGGQVPGMSLNSVQPSALGLGYGMDPVGYGYG